MLPEEFHFSITPLLLFAATQGIVLESLRFHNHARQKWCKGLVEERWEGTSGEGSRGVMTVMGAAEIRVLDGDLIWTKVYVVDGRSVSAHLLMSDIRMRQTHTE